MIRPYTKADQTDGGRVKRRAARKAQAASDERNCYRAVDARDQRRCRVCGKRGSSSAASMLDRLHHHHMVYRSRGGQHEPSCVLSLCAECHNQIHVEHTLRVEGDANLRSAETGQLCGVRCERFGDSGWRVVGWV